MASVQIMDIMTLDYDKLAAPIPDLAFNSYANVGSPNANQMEVRVQVTPSAGVYLFGISMQYTVVGSNTGTIDYRFTFNGGSNWNNFTKEVSGNDDTVAIEYMFPYVHGGGALDLVFQATKQNGSISVEFADIWFQRMGNVTPGAVTSDFWPGNPLSDSISALSDV